LEDYFDDGGKKSYFSNMVVLFLCVILLGYSRKIKYEKIEDDNEYEIINNLNEIELINLEENGNNLEQVPIK